MVTRARPSARISSTPVPTMPARGRAGPDRVDAVAEPGAAGGVLAGLPHPLGVPHLGRWAGDDVAHPARLAAPGPGPAGHRAAGARLGVRAGWRRRAHPARAGAGDPGVL